MKSSVRVVMWALLGVVGYAGPAVAYRTAANLPEYPNDVPVSWSGTSVQYQLDEHVPLGLSSHLVEAAVDAAFASWDGVACAAIDTVAGPSTNQTPIPGDGRVTVSWQTDWAGLGLSPTASATTDIVYSLGADGVWQITDADIYLNELGFEWSTDPAAGGGSRDVKTVVTHEVGHVLGLLHPCENGGANGAPDCFTDLSFAETTMYPDYQGLEQATLSADDEEGLCFLYPYGDPSPLVCAEGMVVTEDGCRFLCGEAPCLAGEICVGGECIDGTDPCTDPGCVELGLPGDPCQLADDCRGAVCSSDGYCTEPCISDDCRFGGFTCSPDEQICVSELGVFGEPCDFAEDCLSRLCLDGDRVAPACTRLCAADTYDCPVGYRCEPIEADHVCVPKPSGGCATLPGRPGSNLTGFLFLILMAMTIRRRRRDY